ncbi:hypothetical protein EBU99_03580 [bacterium]|nr:hypothetical protein [bacterium]
MKSKLMKTLAIVAVPVLFSGCLSDRALILSVPVVSMTDSNVPKGQAVSQGKAGTARYCLSDKAISTKERTVGLIDELVTRGQKASKAKFLTDAQLFHAGGECYELDFKAGVIGAAGEKKEKAPAEGESES